MLLLHMLGMIFGIYFRVLQDETTASLKTFDFNASTLYLVSMSTFWILTIATGEFDLRCTSLQNALLKAITAHVTAAIEGQMPGDGKNRSGLTLNTHALGSYTLLSVCQAVR